ncbi:hypothetical protein HDU97_009954, partial [Phlyctochytrium planicorne]
GQFSSDNPTVKALTELHVALGHPGRRTLHRILKDAKQYGLDVASDLRRHLRFLPDCLVCVQSKTTSSRNMNDPTRVGLARFERLHFDLGFGPGNVPGEAANHIKDVITSVRREFQHTDFEPVVKEVRFDGGG